MIMPFIATVDMDQATTITTSVKIQAILQKECILLRLKNASLTAVLTVMPSSTQEKASPFGRPRNSLIQALLSTSVVICGQCWARLADWRFLLTFAIMKFTGKLIIAAKSMNTCVVLTIGDECRFYSSVLSSSFLHVT